jgi:hypothetical protein
MVSTAELPKNYAVSSSSPSRADDRETLSFLSWISGRLQNEIFGTASADSIDDLVALFPGSKEFAKKLRGVLQIGIDLNRGSPVGIEIVCQDRGLKTEISGEAKHANSIVPTRFIRQPAASNWSCCVRPIVVVRLG